MANNCITTPIFNKDMVMVVQILEDEREGNDYLAQRFMYLVNIDIGNICC